MKLFPAYFGAPRRDDDDVAPPAVEPDPESRADVFNLIPPRVPDPLAMPETPELPATSVVETAEPEKAEPASSELPPSLDEAPETAELAEPVEPPPVAALPEPLKAETPLLRIEEPKQAPPLIMDVSRLTIDADGRLRWDGQAVEVRRRWKMSVGQVLAGVVVVLFFVIGAIGAGVQGSLAAHAFACRLGWMTSYCPAPPPEPARAAPDIAS
jgi:hypothetical protein